MIVVFAIVCALCSAQKTPALFPVKSAILTCEFASSHLFVKKRKAKAVNAQGQSGVGQMLSETASAASDWTALENVINMANRDNDKPVVAASWSACKHHR